MAEPVCSNVSVDVPITTGKHAVTTSWMSGELIRPTAGQPDVLVVMIPGSIESSRYFEVTFQPETYNSALALRRAGYSTLTLDRLGTRASGRPESRQVDAVAQVSAIHRVVQAARNGDFGFVPSKVVAYGHSMGSMIAVAAQAVHSTDFDALVLTGYAHAPAPEPIIDAIYATSIPANQSTEIANNGYDDGYVTGAPLPDDADPPTGIAEYVRQNMSVTSTSEADCVQLSVSSDLSNAITVPVMVAVGREDAIFCSALSPGNDCSTPESLAATEAPRWPASPLVRVTVVDGPHEVQVGPGAPRLAQQVAAFLREALA